MEELKKLIVSLNNQKNSYAAQKMKGESVNDKDLISSLIYCIAECRRVASDIGISDDGKINRDEQSITIFRHLNQNVKDLKDQIVMLTKSTTEELKLLMREQADKHYIEEKEKKEKSHGKDEKTRQNEMRDHLREKLLQKSSSAVVDEEKNDNDQ